MSSLAPGYGQLRVVEIASGYSGAFAAKQFADQGARVVRVEPPGGSADRGEGERLPRHAFGDGAIGAGWAYVNTAKSIAELEPGSAALERLLDHADVVIESSAPGPLRSLAAERSDERLIKVCISPLGLDGPLAEWRSNVFTDDALGGHMYLNGEPDREPIRRLGRHTECSGGMYGYIGAMAALLARERTGRGQTVEIAHMECMVAMHQHTTSMWSHGGHILRREGNAQPGVWHPAGVYECKDGYVFLCHAGGAKLVPFLEAAGLGHILEDPRFATDVDRGARKKEFNEAIRPWLMSQTVEELCELGEATFSPMGPVWDTHQYLADPHLHAREFLVPLDAERGDEAIPRGSFRIGDGAGNPRPPERLDDAGLDAFCARPPHAPEGTGEELADGPLSGIRVLDLTRVWAGPIAGRLLADLGADTIHIKSPWNRGPKEAPPGIADLTHLYPENLVGERHWNRTGGFNKLARNKRSLVLDLANPRGQRIFRRLISQSDVILENFSPRVFPQWNLGPEAYAQLNPDVIHTAMPGYGAFGPGANRVALGPVIEAATGMTAMTGYADSGPYRSGVAWPDPVSGMSAVAGTLTALWRRAAALQAARPARWVGRVGARRAGGAARRDRRGDQPLDALDHALGCGRPAASDGHHRRPGRGFARSVGERPSPGPRFLGAARLGGGRADAVSRLPRPPLRHSGHLPPAAADVRRAQRRDPAAAPAPARRRGRGLGSPRGHPRRTAQPPQSHLAVQTHGGVERED